MKNQNGKQQNNGRSTSARYEFEAANPAKPSLQSKSVPPFFMEVDLEEFVHFLDGTNMTEAQKLECVAVHWRIICEALMLGLKIHPVQQAQKNCGKNRNPHDTPVFSGQSGILLSEEFIEMKMPEQADLEADKPEGGITK